ncbi:ACP1 isoform 9 [Pongo abelii]|uniref:ACP1 isoform 7 n=1 Tax=Pongo abelii TaxID=9601 RepID=A0A2J8SHE8_PONAB|nr:ACP1 isoform 7 [Pongo abelii]PNJ20194.1 ACP1 isoform 9 [Pongo abelii]
MAEQSTKSVLFVCLGKIFCCCGNYSVCGEKVTFVDHPLQKQFSGNL